MRLELDELTDDAAERAAFEQIAVILSATTSDDIATDDPPADLWDRIAARLHDDAPPSGGWTTATVTALESRRNHNLGRYLMATAAAVLVIVAAGALIVNRTSTGGTELVASTDLGLLAGGGAGSAQLVQRADGLHIVVDVSDLSPAERKDFYELWLLAPDGSNPQSLTKFTESSGVIDAQVPAGVDTASFPVVDISEEVDDGDTSHSGKSILRGTLS